MLAILLLLLLSPPVAATDAIAGQATVIDGDTLEIHGQRIRLHGVDAPESRQSCEDGTGRSYACGRMAAFALADWIGRAVVTCDPRDRDRYGRIVATCTVRGEDMSAWLVQSGHALAFRRYSLDYVGAEDDARHRGAGIWQGRFTAPWGWRRGER
ncbi:MAG: thermonuclease family protein [Microvirga sp.]|jgi:endonuclease YncB( thermonuclease family)|nr:thermonuclease family protein [Microvirga sp.]